VYADTTGENKKGQALAVTLKIENKERGIFAEKKHRAGFIPRSV
jgi:hypothetical protein